MATPFATFIREEMSRRGWDQSQLAQRADMSGSGLSDLLNKDRKPDLETILKLADALELPRTTALAAAGYAVEGKSDEHALRQSAAFLQTDPKLQSMLQRIIRLDPADRLFIETALEIFEKRKGL